MQVVIAGRGAWGKALYSLIEQNTASVSFWERETPIREAEVLVLAVPTEAIRSVLSFVQKPHIVVVNSTKGIESSTHLLPFQVTKEVLGGSVDYFSLIGPGFADEVVSRTPTLVNLGFFQEESVKDIKQLFETDYFRVRETASLEAIELAGAFKNLYAIIAGLAYGLGFGMNTRSALITLALEEFYLLSDKLGFEIHDNARPAIIGDLVLTCSSTLSRNFTFGRLLVGKSAKDALKEINATVEGYNTLLSLEYFLKKANTDLPLAQFVSTISKAKNHQDIEERFLEFVRNI